MTLLVAVTIKGTLDILIGDRQSQQMISITDLITESYILYVLRISTEETTISINLITMSLSSFEQI